MLREFRDTQLLTNSLGVIIADSYYRMSPAVAEVVATHAWVGSLLRSIIMLVVQLFELSTLYTLITLGALAMFVTEIGVRNRVR